MMVAYKRECFVEGAPPPGTCDNSGSLITSDASGDIAWTPTGDTFHIAADGTQHADGSVTGQVTIGSKLLGTTLTGTLVSLAFTGPGANGGGEVEWIYQVTSCSNGGPTGDMFGLLENDHDPERVGNGFLEVGDFSGGNMQACIGTSGFTGYPPHLEVCVGGS